MANDIHIQIVSVEQYTGMKFYSFGQKRTQGVDGIQKLLNMFAKFLLTPSGSDPLDPTYGTDLMNLLGSNVHPRDARDVLLLAVERTAAAIRGFQNSRDVPDDERLTTSTVTQFLLIDSVGFSAQIFIENALLQGLQFLLPTLEVRT